MEQNKHKLNEWKILSIILVIIAGILLIIIFNENRLENFILEKNIISEKEIGEKAVTFINEQLTQGQASATLDSVKFESGVYNVMVNMDGRKVPVYFTKDGKFISPGSALASITENPVMGNNVADSNTNSNNQQNTPKNVQKSDKPIVEAFIFSYCPYGLQFEKALFLVYDLLKNKADFKIVAIGAMHGEYEKIETLRQISIEQLYGKDKLFAYLKEFNVNTDIGNCRGDEACLNKYLPNIYKKLSIDKTKIENYMKTSAEKLYQEQNARASELGIGGSPTFVINGAQVQVNRSPDSIKSAVCNAFTTTPSECSKTLSTTSANAGFG